MNDNTNDELFLNQVSFDPILKEINSDYKSSIIQFHKSSNIKIPTLSSIFWVNEFGSKENTKAGKQVKAAREEIIKESYEE